MTGRMMVNVGMCLKILDFQHQGLKRTKRPLTCRKHSDTMLIPIIEGDKVVLRCPRYKDCDYQQELTPALLKIIEDCLLGLATEEALKSR